MSTLQPTHKVILTYGDTDARVRYVFDGAAGLQTLADEAAANGVTHAQAVVLDPTNPAYDTLFRLGWAAREPEPQECQHTSSTATADAENMRYDVSCNGCARSWSFEDLDLPAVVENQARPVWEAHGF